MIMTLGFYRLDNSSFVRFSASLLLLPFHSLRVALRCAWFPDQSGLFVCLFVYFTSDVLFWALLKRCEVRTLVHRRGKKKKTIFLTLAFSQRDGRQGFEIRLFRSIPAFRFNPNDGSSEIWSLVMLWDWISIALKR